MTRQIHYEQAVYGSFPFWRRGYAVLAKSAACRGEWLDALRLAGQRFGERPTGVVNHASLFALHLPRGPWMIVGVFPNGCDDQGRPGALAFHGLYVSRWMYFRAGRNPFAFAGVMRRDWSETDVNVTLPAGDLAVPIWNRDRRAGKAPTDPRVKRIVTAIKLKQRVVIPSAEPIDDLAQAVWRVLPGWARRRASVATWAFGNDNRFDLVAVPRLGTLIPDPAELILEPQSIERQS